MAKSTFDIAMEKIQAPNPNAIASVFEAYKAGKMSPAEAQEFERDVKSGVIMLPRGASLAGQEPDGPKMLPQSVSDAYAQGKLSEQERADLEADIKAGLVRLPPQLSAMIPSEDPNWNPPTEQGIIPQQKAPTLGERLIGTGEAGLATVTGMTGGLAGTVAGTVEGITASILNGTYGTPEGAAQAEAIAAQRAGQFTYQPRTEQGMEQAAAVGDAMQQLAPLGPLGGEMAALGAGTKAAAPAARMGAEMAAVRAQHGAAAIMAAVKPKVAAAVDAVKSAPQRVGEKLGITEPAQAPYGQAKSVGAAATSTGVMRDATAENLPVPMELTRGAATRDAEQLAFEKEMTKSPALGGPLRKRAEENNLQALQNMDAVFDMTEAQAPDLSATGNKVTKALSDGYKAAKNKVNVAYAQARKSEEANAAVDPSAAVSIGEGESAINDSLIGYLNKKVSGVPSAAVTDAARKLAVKMGIAREELPSNTSNAIVSGKGEDLITLYHGTSSDNARSISYSGKINEGSYFGGIKGVSLTPRKAVAEEFADGGPVIEVRIPRSRLRVDPESYDGSDINQAIREGASLYSDGSIYLKDPQVTGESRLVGMPTTVGKMEEFRRELSGTAKWDDRVGLREETILKKLIDAQTEPVSGPLFKAARAERAAMARKYENRAVVARLIQTVKGMEDPKVAADQVFQRSILNGSPEEITFLKRVLNTTSGDGQQAWKELQGALVRHIREEATKGLGMDSGDNPIVSPAQLNRVVKQLDKNGRLDIVLGNKRADIIRDLNDVVQYVNTVPPGTLINNSGTFGALLAAMTEAGVNGTMFGAPVPVLSAMRFMVRHINDAKIRKKIQSALNEKTGKLVDDSNKF